MVGLMRSLLARGRRASSARSGRHQRTAIPSAPGERPRDRLETKFVQQTTQLGNGRGQTTIMSESYASGHGQSRLIDIELPRVEIKRAGNSARLGAAERGPRQGVRE